MKMQTPKKEEECFPRKHPYFSELKSGDVFHYPGVGIGPDGSNLMMKIKDVAVRLFDGQVNYGHKPYDLVEIPKIEFIIREVK